MAEKFVLGETKSEARPMALTWRAAQMVQMKGSESSLSQELGTPIYLSS